MPIFRKVSLIYIKKVHFLEQQFKNAIPILTKIPSQTTTSTQCELEALSSPQRRPGQEGQGEQGLYWEGWWQMVGGDEASHCFQLHPNAVQYSPVQCSAVQCSAFQCSLVQCSAVQFSVVYCSVVQHTKVMCSAEHCNSVQPVKVNLSAVQLSAVQCRVVQCNDCLLIQCLTHWVTDSLYKLTQPDELTVLCCTGYSAVKGNILQCNHKKQNAVQ